MTTCGSDKFSSGVRVIDKSKYGTFVSEDSGSKVVRLVRNKDTVLKDGDLVTFGTSNAAFRWIMGLFSVLFRLSMLQLRVYFLPFFRYEITCNWIAGFVMFQSRSSCIARRGNKWIHHFKLLSHLLVCNVSTTYFFNEFAVRNLALVCCHTVSF